MFDGQSEDVFYKELTFHITFLCQEEVMAESNTIEIVKIFTGMVTPLIVAYFGFKLNRTMQQLAAAQWANQKVIEKRISIFDELAPLLNELYCYMIFVGNWKELTPADIIRYKRLLDKRIYVSAAFFSPGLVSSYDDFIGCCFETFTGAENDARIRSPIECINGDRRKSLPTWEKEWDNCFSTSQTTKEVLKVAYNELMAVFSSELWFGIHDLKQELKIRSQ